MSHKTLRIELIGHREGEYDGKVIKVPETKGVVPIVCRDALENGYEPDSVVEVYRKGTRCFLPQTLKPGPTFQSTRTLIGSQYTRMCRLMLLT